MPGTDERLLSDGALRNVMRATLDNDALAMSTSYWIKDLSPHKQVTWYTAAAHAFIGLLDDHSPCRFDTKSSVDRAASFKTVFPLHDGKLVEAVKKKIGEEWDKLASRLG